MDSIEQRIRLAKREAERFIGAADSALRRLSQDGYAHFGCKETAACKRASMDLTRSLVNVRQLPRDVAERSGP